MWELASLAWISVVWHESSVDKARPPTECVWNMTKPSNASVKAWSAQACISGSSGTADIHLFWTINCPALAILIKTLFFETLQKIVCGCTSNSGSVTNVPKLTCGKATQNVRQEHSSESISRSLLIYCTITDTFFMSPLISISSMVCLKSAFIC